jgi:hypothetical protein
MRFMMESEQFLFHHLEETGNCLVFDPDLIGEIERRVTEIALFNHRNRFVFLSFVQLILQSRVFFARGDFMTGKRLVFEVVSMADEFSEVDYRLRNSPYGYDSSYQRRVAGHGSRPGNGSCASGVLLRFPRFFGLVHEPLVLDLFYRGEYASAAELLYQYLPAAGSERSSGVPSRWYIIQAFVHFKQGELHRAAHVVRCLERIPDGRTSWGIGLRLLAIYLSAENSAFDLASHQVESLRKYMERQQRIKPFTKREVLICRVLIALVRSDFEFAKVASGYAAELDQLRETIGNHAWHPGGYELIPFHEWFSSKSGSGR